jgi:hypothetical protein
VFIAERRNISTWTWSITFFEWYTHSNSGEEIDNFRKRWEDDVYTAVEMLKQPYDTITNMPVQKLKNLIRWKNKLEGDKEKLLKELKDG